MKSFKDNVVWITGASSGIGEALALELAARGARLVLSARRAHELERVGKACGLAPLDLMILPFDLGDTSNATGLAAQVINKFGRIDILINNGGVSQRSEVLDTDPVTERQLMEVNYFAQVNLARAVLPYMVRQKAGQLVVISSIAGKFGFFLRSTYSAAKHALHGYFESLRLEYENKGISVLMVCPGKIRTNVSVNALASGAVAHGRMDESHTNAMSAGTCAKKISVAILAREKEVLIGGKETVLPLLKRFTPRLFYRLIRRQSPF
jgi:dehydrogenase/reductase SDR family member 7B